MFSSLVIFYIFLTVNKSDEKNKTNTELLQVLSVSPKPDIVYSSAP